MSTQSERVPVTDSHHDLSLERLQAELARIDVLVCYEVRRWEVAGQDPAVAFRRLHVSQAEAAAVANRSPGVSWGQTAALAPMEQKAFSAAYAQAAERADGLVLEAKQRGKMLRLEHLVAVFDLDAYDRDTLLNCLALALDLRYQRLYGYLQDDVTRKRPTVNLVLDLLGPADPAARPASLLRFADDAPLFKYHLLDRGQEQGSGHPPLLGEMLGLDPAAVSWLLGRYVPHSTPGGYASPSWPEADRADVLLAGGADRCRELLECVGGGSASAQPGAPIVVFHEPDEVSQQAASRVLAVHAERPLLTVDLAPVIQGRVDPLLALRLAQRGARLTGCDDCFSSEEAASAPPDLLEELCGFPGLVIVGGRSAWSPSGTGQQRPPAWMAFPIPGYAQRLTLWRHFMERELSDLPKRVRESPAYLEAIGVRALAGQFSLTTGQIRDSAASVRDHLFQAGRSLRREDLFAAARAHSNPRLAELARKIEPRYGWSDIILPDDQLDLLREIVATVRGRPVVLEEWGVGRKLASSAGVTVLFFGRPGTGKSMGAEMLASELSLDLFKIDLSSIVSKYIGGTEKNLERIFADAQSSNAILFFDEADAIFGKRSEVKDAHDRYANIEVSYLLQRITHGDVRRRHDPGDEPARQPRRSIYEAASVCRGFPFPRRAVPAANLGDAAPPRRAPRAGSRFRTAGSALLPGWRQHPRHPRQRGVPGAADGRRVGMQHLLHGMWHELQKMGRLVKDQDMTWEPPADGAGTVSRTPS